MKHFLPVQISLFLRETWMVSLSNSIRFNLRSLRSYNVNESCWEMYKISKLYRLMALVKFNLEDSLRFLVQDSLASLTELLWDACRNVLMCPQNLIWGNNLITSPYQ